MLKLGRWSEADQSLSLAVNLEPQSPWAHYYHAVARKSMDDLEGASAGYREAIDLYPDEYLFFEGLGDVLHQQGHAREAADAYRRAINITTLPSTCIRLGDVLDALDETEQSIAAYLRAVVINPQNVEPYKKLGRVLERGNRFHEATVVYEQGAALGAVDDELRRMLEELRHRLDPDEAGRRDSSQDSRPVS